MIIIARAPAKVMKDMHWMSGNGDKLFTNNDFFAQSLADFLRGNDAMREKLDIGGVPVNQSSVIFSGDGSSVEVYPDLPFDQLETWLTSQTLNLKMERGN